MASKRAEAEFISETEPFTMDSSEVTRSQAEVERSVRMGRYNKSIGTP